MNTITNYLPDNRAQSYLTTVKGGSAEENTRRRAIAGRTARLRPTAISQASKIAVDQRTEANHHALAEDPHRRSISLSSAR